MDAFFRCLSQPQALHGMRVPVCSFFSSSSLPSPSHIFLQTPTDLWEKILYFQHCPKSAIVDMEKVMFGWESIEEKLERIDAEREARENLGEETEKEERRW